jgi:maltose O-acetyltransferase
MDLEAQFAHMATGAMYDDLTPELIAARVAAVRATDEYNRSYGELPSARESLLSHVIGSLGRDVNFEPTFRCEFGRNIHIGSHFFANFDCVLLDGARITIGDHVLIGPKVGMYTSNHAFDPAEREAGACRARPITIGDRVWIAAGVTVLPGVTIGEGAIIGAGSVVTADVPAGTIAAGNPARVLREITEEDRTDYRPSH